LVAAPSAALTVDAPEHLRGGLIFEGRFEVDARTRISQPKLVLSSGWTEGMTLNSTSPQPTAEQSRGGLLTMAFAPVAEGQHFTVWTQWSVNPVNVGQRSQDVVLYDGAKRLASVEREVTVFP
jgi:hypothetical protein